MPLHPRTVHGLATADVVLQATLILVGGLAVLNAAEYTHFAVAMYVYLIVGGWQVLSMILHAVGTTHLRRWTKRAVHHVVLVSVLGLLLLVGVQDPDRVIVALMVLFGISPILALWYFGICWREVWRDGRALRAQTGA